MPTLFSDLLKDPAFEVSNRRAVKELYETVKTAVRAKKLNLEGHTLPTSLNDWIKQVEGDKKLPARDVDVVDFSLAEDKKLDKWRKTYLASKNPVLMSQGAKNMLEAVQELETANKNSMTLMNGNKDDVVAALSDLQAAVYLFMTTYDKVSSGLKLPERSTPLERVKIGKAKAARTKKESAAPEPSAPKKKPKRAVRETPRSKELSA